MRFFLLLLLTVGPAQAGLEGGLVPSAIYRSEGGPWRTSGTLGLFAVGRSSWTSSGVSYVLDAGIWTDLADVLLVAAWLGAEPEAAGIRFGVDPQKAVRLGFSRPIHPDFSDKLLVWLERDERDVSVSRPVSVQASLADLQTISFFPPDGWLPNGFYRVDLSTRLADAEGRPLEEPVSFRFRVKMVAGRAYRLATEDGTAEVEFPAGALEGPASFVLEAAKEEPLRNSIAAMEARGYHGPLAGPLRIRSFPEEARFLEPVRVWLAAPAGRGIAVYRSASEKGPWIRLPDPEIHKNGVAGRTRSFSYFAVFRAPDRSVEEVFVFPVPWRPNDGNPETGTPDSGVHFANLPDRVSLSVLDVAGEKIWEVRDAQGPEVIWDGRDRAGRPVASGTYVWIAESGENRRTGKLMVIR